MMKEPLGSFLLNYKHLVWSEKATACPEQNDKFTEMEQDTCIQFGERTKMRGGGCYSLLLYISYNVPMNNKLE